ncbi:MAG: hypothetical protein ACXWQR_08200 [Ktedonobacterales bacterium]
MADAQMPSDDLWQRLVAANREYNDALYAVRRAAAAKSQTRRGLIEILRNGLTSATHQHLAVELLRHVDEEFQRALFFEIVYVAMTTERDMLKAFNIIHAMDREWVREHAPAAVQDVLDQPWADYGEYRAAAVLLNEIQSPYLARVVEQANASDNYDIREVADDFREAAATLQRNEGGSQE